MLKVQIDISRGRIIGNGVVEYNVYKLPDCSLLYYVKFDGRVELLFMSDITEQLGDNYYRQKYSIFDKQFSTCHTGDLCLTCTYRGTNIFDIDIESGGSRWTFGYLEVIPGVEIKWKGECVSDEYVRTLYAKALLLAK